jgi:hypothetical protein
VATTLPAWIDKAAHVTDHTTAWDPVPGVVIDRYPDGSLRIAWLDGSGITEPIPADQTDTLRCGLVHIDSDPCTQCESDHEPAPAHYAAQVTA